MKECFVITSYCDTEQKIKVLKSTIDNIKRFGKDIAIHAHFPLTVDIQKSVKYYISSENFIMDNESKVSWYIMSRGNYKMYNYKVNYNYTVIKQFKESISLLFSMDYDVLHFVCYDANITDELYNMSKNSDLSIFYENFFYKGDIMAIYFSIKKKDENFFNDIFSYEAYKKSKDYAIEEYLSNKIKKIDVNVVPIENYDYKILYINDISTEGGTTFFDTYSGKLNEHNFKFFFKREGYSVFGGYFNKTFAILFYDIEKELNIEVEVKNDKYNLTINNMFFMDTNIKIDELNGKDVSIKVNEDVIDDYLIDRILQNKIELEYNDKW